MNKQDVIIPNDDQLLHYGVLGMKWGIRRGRSTSSTSGKRKFRIFKKNISKEADQQPIKNKKVDTLAREAQFRQEYYHRDKMTTRQIQARNNRIRAEQEFERLTGEPARVRARAEAERKAKKRARNLKIAGTVATVVGSMSSEQMARQLTSKSDNMSKDDFEKLVKNNKKTIEALQVPIGTAGKLMTEFSKVKQSALSKEDVYIPGMTGNSEQLLHYGVPGMKKGVRRRQYVKKGAASQQRSYAVSRGKMRLAQKQLRISRKINKSVGVLDRGAKRAVKQQYRINKKNYKLARKEFKRDKHLYKIKKKDLKREFKEKYKSK